MQLEVGNIVEGKITGITNFGAFVSLPESKTGMVHISEISNSYVKDISDHLTDGQDITVKVLSIADDGKIGLSIKALEEQVQPKVESKPREKRVERTDSEQRPRPQAQQRRSSSPPQERRNSGSSQGTWQPKSSSAGEDSSFEDMLTRFKQSSNDRMSDLKRSQDTQRSRRSTGGSQN